jgi:hypothetical protein
LPEGYQMALAATQLLGHFRFSYEDLLLVFHANWDFLTSEYSLRASMDF